MSPPTINGDSWDRWAKHVLAELERLNMVVAGLQNEISELRVDIATAKVKIGATSALLGVVGGIVPVVIMILVQFFKK